MARPYFKEWRKRRHLTQDQVVDRLAALADPQIPQTTASLSRLENGRQPYNQRSLEALAEVYEVEADELLRPPPLDDEMDLRGYISGLDPVNQRRVLAMLRAMEDADAFVTAGKAENTA